MATFKAGDVFLSTKTAGGTCAWHYDGHSLALLDTYSQPPENQYCGVFGDPRGHFWCPTFANKSVVIRNRTGAVLTTISGLVSSPESVLFDNNFAYLGLVDDGVLQKYTLDGAYVASYGLPVGDRGVDHLEWAPDGTTILYTSEDETIRTWNPLTGGTGTFATIPGGFITSYVIRRVPSDGSYVIIDDGDVARVVRLSSSGAFMRAYAVVDPPDWQPFGLDVEVDGLHMWVGVHEHPDTAKALKYNLASGAVVATINTGTQIVGFNGTSVNVVTTKQPMLKVY